VVDISSVTLLIYDPAPWAADLGTTGLACPHILPTKRLVGKLYRSRIDETSRFAVHDGVRIHYRDWAGLDENAPPVVFVPGMTDVAADYDGVADVIGRRTIVVELRGHGLSDAPPKGYHLDDHVADIDAVVGDAVGPSSPVHLMTFSRGTAYTFGWIEQHPERVLSLSIGDYPAREIAIPVAVADSLLQKRWRGTLVSDRLDAAAAVGKFAASRDHPRWDLVAELAGGGVPVLVVRSTATAPLNDDDWACYHELDAPIELVHFDDSPHDIFRPDRSRYPRLVRDLVARADERVRR